MFPKLFKTITVDKFTFHYVSIKSLTNNAKFKEKFGFTFHYVSIKSEWKIISIKSLQRFTFHYVSIKSNSSLKHCM